MSRVCLCVSSPSQDEGSEAGASGGWGSSASAAACLIQSPTPGAGEAPCRTHVWTHRMHLALRHCVGMVAPLS